LGGAPVIRFNPRPKRQRFSTIILIPKDENAKLVSFIINISHQIFTQAIVKTNINFKFDQIELAVNDIVSKRI
jgi:hypothetical protein